MNPRAASGNDFPLVSIVVPAYNAARFLRASLESIVAQTYPNKEIILMDDGSGDATGEIARSYGERITYYRQPFNRGQFGNVNDGIRLARGKYVAVYHSDDIYHPEIVAREVAFMESYPQTAAVFAMEIFMDADGQERGRLELAPEIPLDAPISYQQILNILLRYKNCIFPAPSSMVRAAVYQNLEPYRGDEYAVAADFEMFFRIARQYPVAILGEHLFRYRWGHGNADQMDRLLRLTPEPYFAIMDDHLTHGGLQLALKDALAAHEAHRGEDAIMRAINCYILGRDSQIPAILAETSPNRLLASSKVQGIRLTMLYGLLLILVRFPHVQTISQAFRRRWYSRASDAAIEKARSLRTAAAVSRTA
jgi:hypothetical protein